MKSDLYVIKMWVRRIPGKVLKTSLVHRTQLIKHILKDTVQTADIIRQIIQILLI